MNQEKNYKWKFMTTTSGREIMIKEFKFFLLFLLKLTFEFDLSNIFLKFRCKVVDDILL